MYWTPWDRNFIMLSHITFHIYWTLWGSKVSIAITSIFRVTFTLNTLRHGSLYCYHICFTHTLDTLRQESLHCYHICFTHTLDTLRQESLHCCYRICFSHTLDTLGEESLHYYHNVLYWTPWDRKATLCEHLLILNTLGRNVYIAITFAFSHALDTLGQKCLHCCHILLFYWTPWGNKVSIAITLILQLSIHIGQWTPWDREVYIAITFAFHMYIGHPETGKFTLLSHFALHIHWTPWDRNVYIATGAFAGLILGRCGLR